MCRASPAASATSCRGLRREGRNFWKPTGRERACQQRHQQGEKRCRGEEEKQAENKVTIRNTAIIKQGGEKTNPEGNQPRAVRIQITKAQVSFSSTSPAFSLHPQESLHHSSPKSISEVFRVPPVLQKNRHTHTHTCVQAVFFRIMGAPGGPRGAEM